MVSQHPQLAPWLLTFLVRSLPVLFQLSSGFDWRVKARSELFNEAWLPAAGHSGPHGVSALLLWRDRRCRGREPRGRWFEAMMCSEETEYRENRLHGRSRALAALVSLAALFCFSLWPQGFFFSSWKLLALGDV